MSYRHHVAELLMDSCKCRPYDAAISSFSILLLLRYYYTALLPHRDELRNEAVRPSVRPSVRAVPAHKYRTKGHRNFKFGEKYFLLHMYNCLQAERSRRRVT